MAIPIIRLQAGRTAVSCAAKGEAANTGFGTMRMLDNGPMNVSPWQILMENGRMRRLLLEQQDVLEGLDDVTNNVHEEMEYIKYTQPSKSLD